MRTAESALGALLISTAKHQGSFAALLARHPSVRLVGVADEADAAPWIRENNQKLADQLGLPYWEDLDEALERPDVHLVSICSEYSRHGPLTMRALAAGKHVLLDKQPIGMTVSEGEAVCAAARSAAAQGVKFTYVHHCSDQTVRRARDAIMGGEIGTPRAVVVTMVASTGPGDAEEIGPTSRWGKAYHPQWWGGGEIMHHAGYGIGCARYLMASEATAVYAMAGAFFNKLNRETGAEDLATLSLRYANGGVGTVVVGRAPNAADLSSGDHFIHVVGSRGIATANMDGPAFLLRDPAAGGSRRVQYAAGSVALVIDEFVQAIVGGTEPSRGAEDGLAELRVMLAAYDSLRSGRDVTL